MFLLPSPLKKKAAPEKEAPILVCPECAENLVSTVNEHVCIGCHKRFANAELMKAYCDAAKANHRQKVNQRFRDFSIQSLNEALVRERKVNHDLRLENDRLRNENLARDPLFQSERLASLEARMSSMETLLHDLVEDC